MVYRELHESLGNFGDKKIAVEITAIETEKGCMYKAYIYTVGKAYIYYGTFLIFGNVLITALENVIDEIYMAKTKYHLKSKEIKFIKSKMKEIYNKF